jgi:hypothetical protein
MFANSSQSELESKTLQILKKGYMPADNKNLITFVSITTLFAITTAAAFALGFQLRANTVQSNLTSLQEYRQLEADIIDNYENRHGLSSTIDINNNHPVYKYYNQDGLLTTIGAIPKPK